MDIVQETPIKKFSINNLNQVFLVTIIASIVLGVGAGVLLAKNKSSSNSLIPINSTPKTASQDNRTFKDFAQGTLQKRPAPKNPNEYVEGTHILVREGQTSVALTSSVVDLSQYEGKKVKVFGETQKAIKEGWLMDVGKVETN